MLSVELLRSQRELESFLMGSKAHAVIATFRVDHAFGEGAGVDQISKRSGEVAIFLFVLPLSTQNGAHVTEGARLGVGAGWIAREFGLINGLSADGRGCQEEGNNEPANYASVSWFHPFRLPFSGILPCYSRNWRFVTVCLAGGGNAVC
jgi:hypothetical protein